MTTRSIRWDGTDAAWDAIAELYKDLELVVFREGNLLDAGTWEGQVPVLIGQWIVRRDDAIEVWSSDPGAASTSR
jgi:hypothetical protein